MKSNFKNPHYYPSTSITNYFNCKTWVHNKHSALKRSTFLKLNFYFVVVVMECHYHFVMPSDCLQYH